MPKAVRTSSQKQHRSIPVVIASGVPQPDVDYFTDMAAAIQVNPLHQSLPPHMSSYSNNHMHTMSSLPQYEHHVLQPQHILHNLPGRASSGAWTPADDATLMTARSAGQNWAPIQAAYFPNKTPNACRKRHERLMDRRNSDDWDVVKLERMAKEYMDVRKEMWTTLADRTGEKWSVVEAKCMTSGLKNLQSSARACARRERLSQADNQYASMHHHSHSGDQSAYTDDSGIGLDDLDIDEEVVSSAYGQDPGSSGLYVGGSSSVIGHGHGLHSQHHPHFVMASMPESNGQSLSPAPDASHSSRTRYDVLVGHPGMGGVSQRQPYAIHGQQEQRASTIGMGIGAIINRQG